MEFYYPLQMTEDSNTMMKEMKVGANTKMVAKGHTGVKMLVFILILTDIFSIFRSWVFHSIFWVCISSLIYFYLCCIRFIFTFLVPSFFTSLPADAQNHFRSIRRFFLHIIHIGSHARKYKIVCICVPRLFSLISMVLYYNRKLLFKIFWSLMMK